MTDAIPRAHERMNLLNAQDPTSIDTPEGPRPRELVMAERLEKWVYRVAAASRGKVPDALDDATIENAGIPSLPLILAARGQHLMRWTVPRSDYDAGRVGYLKWRKDLSKMHADKVTEILRSEGFDEETIAATREINLKQNLKTNRDTQTMEDALCLSFLEHEFDEFCNKHEDDKVVDIVQKTWGKMSPVGHDLALRLPFEGRAKDLVLRALKDA